MKFRPNYGSCCDTKTCDFFFSFESTETSKTACVMDAEDFFMVIDVLFILLGSLALSGVI